MQPIYGQAQMPQQRYNLGQQEKFGIGQDLDHTITPKAVTMTRESHRAASREKKTYYNNYKDITFDTLKERHDNFSIDKVIQTKNQVYNTLHFQGI